MRMNEEQLGLMSRDLSEIPPDRVLQAMLEAVLQAKPKQAIGQ